MYDREDGNPSLLGAHWDKDHEWLNVAVVSNAQAHDGWVILCLIEDDGSETQLALSAPGPDTPVDVWHAKVKGVRRGQRYGFRACGHHDPGRGTFFNPLDLLADPYARAFTPNPVDPRRPFSVIPEVEDFDWEGDLLRTRKPLAETVIYETQVRSLTMARLDIPAARRGTFSAVSSPGVIDHLKELGVTAVELMPVQQHVTEQSLLSRGQTNLWGYSTLGFFAPDYRFSCHGSRGGQVTEFKSMVKELHRAGLEVILDVVYNHTAEGGTDQPNLCWRGLANDLFYQLDARDRSHYVDVTGAGNSLDLGRDHVQTLVLDSLHYWVDEMHVDGFRFDLASSLFRHDGMFDSNAAFFNKLTTDFGPRVKLIAEPWDSGGEFGYQLGSFRAPWTQWNDQFRDTVRRFWLAGGGPGELRRRLAGSPDLIKPEITEGVDRDVAFVNFVSAHDGRTALDLVTYANKHNEANGQDNTDGRNGEIAVNYGIEGPAHGPTDERRRRDVSAMLALVLLGRGVPMLLGGDELLRTQGGNNNAYCQDNPTSWYDWSPSVAAAELVSLIKKVNAFRTRHPGCATGWAAPEAQADRIKVWAQVPRNGGEFLGLALTCEHPPAGGSGDDERPHTIAIMINSDTDAVQAEVPLQPEGRWQLAWSSHPDPGGSPLRISGRSVAAAITYG